MDSLQATVEKAIGNQYEVLHLIGRGGMGAVYLARERFLERLVAVKVLPQDAAGDRGGRERFLREAQTAARLSHPSIVPLFTFTEAEGTLLYVMGYVAGESLEARLVREGRLPAEQAARILSEIADALDYAHSMGVVHRDVKPDNILIDQQTGRAFLTDFGIAKQTANASLTKTGMVVGTPHYMSPEQGVGDRDVDGRSDLYSLGVIGYRMLSGRLPFDAQGVQELLMQHMSRAPAPLTLDAPNSNLASAVMRCLQKDPADRWATGATLVDALRLRTDHEIDLPDELASIPSSGATFLVVLYGFLLGLGLLYAVSPDPIEIVFAGALTLSLPVVLGSYAVMAKRYGLHWRKLTTIAYYAPKEWRLWWPRKLRRPGDIWDRLPRSIRRMRTGMTLYFGSMFGVVIPAMVLVLTLSLVDNNVASRVVGRWVFLPSLILGLGLAVACLFMALPPFRGFKAPKGLLQRLLWEPTWNNPFWKRPEAEAVLVRETPAAEANVPGTPAQIVEAIERAALALPAPIRPLGEQAIAGARDLDREMAELSREADPAERARLEQKLASSKTAVVQGSGRSPMRELLEQQLALMDQLDVRRRQLGDDRDRSIGLLKNLWLQLASSRGQPALDAMSASGLSDQIRAVCADLENHRAAMREVDAIVARTITTNPPLR